MPEESRVDQVRDQEVIPGRFPGAQMSVFANRSIIVRIASGLLALAAFAVLFSMGLSLVWPTGPRFFVGVGLFLVGAFSWASIYVPSWLGCLAVLVLLPEFHPRTMYLLVASLLPFLVLSAYARVSTNPVRVFDSWPLLAAVGLRSIQASLVIIGLLTLGLIAFGYFRIQDYLKSLTSEIIVPGREIPQPPAGNTYESVQTKDSGKKRATKKTRKTTGGIDTASFDPASINIKLPKLPPRPVFDPVSGRLVRDEYDEVDAVDAVDAVDEAKEGGLSGFGIVDGEDPGSQPVTHVSRERVKGRFNPSDNPDLRYNVGGIRSIDGGAILVDPSAEPALTRRYSADYRQDVSSLEDSGLTDAEANSRFLDIEERTMIERDPFPHTGSKVMSAGYVSAEGLVTPTVVNLPGTGTIEFTSIPPQPTSHDEGWAGEQAGEVAIKRILARKKEKAYFVPVDGILNTYPDGQYWIIDDKTRESAEVLRATLAEFGIEAEVTGIRKGPVITMFEILPAPGVKLSKITNLGDNIALRLAASSVRIVAPIPGKHAVGIEVPNEKRAIVSLREIVDNEGFKVAKMEIPVVLGKDIAGEVQFVDLASMPHLLIAGATGSGKSVCVNSIILSILYRRSPEDVRLLLIDPKIVELKLYNDIPHLLTPVITEPKRAFQALQYCICEMERRYSMLDKVGVRDIRSYNRRVKEKNLAQEKLPYIVVIVDEFADLMATTGKELESTLARLAAMSRAVGIHLVLATQRPSIDVITGLIKANIPSRIAFMVAGKFDSRIIIDMVGAEKLLGKGDMLFSGAADPFPVRMQGAFVSDDEVEKAVEFVRTLGEPDYIDDEIFFDEDEEDADPTLFDDGDGDPLFEKALEIVMQQGKASASYIQRRLKVGYNRAARIVELMEKRGIVGPAQGSKPRDLVRNPDVMGRNNTGDSPGRPDHGDRLTGDRGAREGGASARRSSLIPNPETVPGQRVTGRDEED